MNCGPDAKNQSDKTCATAVRRKRGRKCKSGEEAGAPELKANVARTSEAQVEDEIAPQPWRAPVARMWQRR